MKGTRNPPRRTVSARKGPSPQEAGPARYVRQAPQVGEPLHNCARIFIVKMRKTRILTDQFVSPRAVNPTDCHFRCPVPSDGHAQRVRIAY